MPPLTLSLEGGLSPALVDRLHAYLEACSLDLGIGPDLGPVIAMVVEEICTNIMEHSGATWLELSLARRHGHIWVGVSDNGQPFDTCKAILAKGKLSLPEVQERRLGLHVVDELTSTVRSDRDPVGHNRVEFEFDAQDPGKADEAGAVLAGRRLRRLSEPGLRCAG